MKVRFLLPVKTITVLTIILSLIFITAFEIKNDKRVVVDHDVKTETISYKDSAASIKAFMDVYKVLMSPRCLNCHPAGDVPLQGDDSRLHQMFPKRGKDGKGIYAMKCSNCHQAKNAPGLHAPPGNPKWHLPPSNMKMVFEGRTPRQLALQIMDYRRNGNKNKAQLLEHARDTLVKAGWNMGEGRKPPPLSYDAFVTAWDTWINTGAYAPKR